MRGPCSAISRAGRVDRPVVPVHHQIAQTRRPPRTAASPRRAPPRRAGARCGCGAVDHVNLGAQQQIGERAVGGGPTAATAIRRTTPRCRADAPGRAAAAARVPAANRRASRTAMPNTARPSVQPVIVGSSQRLTAISTKTSTAAPVNTHHSQPRCGVDSVSSAIVAITATPGSTSTENAPARAGHDAVGGSRRRVAGRRFGARVEHSRHERDLIQPGDLVRAVVGRHLAPAAGNPAPGRRSRSWSP